MNNGEMDRGNENPTQHLPLIIEENHEKTSVRLVGTGILTRDLPNASLVRYHGATSLGSCVLCGLDEVKTYTYIKLARHLITWWLVKDTIYLLNLNDKYEWYDKVFTNVEY